jgi:hypothetical protein
MGITFYGGRYVIRGALAEPAAPCGLHTVPAGTSSPIIGSLGSSRATSSPPDVWASAAGAGLPRGSRRSLTSDGTAGAPAGVIVRVLQRIMAMAAAIWHNGLIGAPIHRSLTASDH